MAIAAPIMSPRVPIFTESERPFFNLRMEKISFLFDKISSLHIYIYIYQPSNLLRKKSKLLILVYHFVHN